MNKATHLRERERERERKREQGGLKNLGRYFIADIIQLTHEYILS